MRKIFKTVFLIIMVISSICVFAGCGNKKVEESVKPEPTKEMYEAPIRNYFEGVKNKDVEQIRKARPSFMPTMTQLDIDLIYAEYEKKFGANIKLDYTLGEAVKLTEQADIDILANQIKELYPDYSNINITSAYIIPVSLTVSGDGVKAEGETEENNEISKKTDTQDFYVFEYEGNWYMF